MMYLSRQTRKDLRSIIREPVTRKEELWSAIFFAFVVGAVIATISFGHTSTHKNTTQKIVKVINRTVRDHTEFQAEMTSPNDANFFLYTADAELIKTLQVGKEVKVSYQEYRLYGHLIGNVEVKTE